MLTDYEIAQLEINVGINPEGVRRETDIIIREIDDELLKLDMVDPNYKAAVSLARDESLLLAMVHSPRPTGIIR